MGDTPSDPKTRSDAIVTESGVDMERRAIEVVLDGVRGDVAVLAWRGMNRGHPCAYIVTDDGTYLVTVEKVSNAIQAQ